MGILGKIFNTDKVIEKTIDTVKHVVDEAFYTKEEQGTAQAAAVTEGRTFLMRWLEATSPSRVARRLIALMTTSVWLGLYLLAAALEFGAIWAGEKVAQLVASAALIDARADEMIPIVGLVYGFYYAAPWMGDFAKGALKRFSDAEKGEGER